MKARLQNLTGHFMHRPRFADNEISNTNAFLRTFPTDTGCWMVEGVLINVSLHNARDRDKARRFAKRILDLCETFDPIEDDENPKWVTFTKRTNNPKLSALEKMLDNAGIVHRRNGWSFHAPILEVLDTDLDAAWEILTPIDDIPDDDPQFRDA